jgi:hypothetical protein
MPERRREIPYSPMEFKGTTDVNARYQPQKATASTKLAVRARADAGSTLNRLTRSAPGSWIGWVALVAGIAGVATSITLTATLAGQGLTVGFAAFIAFFAILSLLARNQTPLIGGFRDRFRTIPAALARRRIRP